jgi:hypothetical protein
LRPAVWERSHYPNPNDDFSLPLLPRFKGQKPIDERVREMAQSLIRLQVSAWSGSRRTSLCHVCNRHSDDWPVGMGVTLVSLHMIRKYPTVRRILSLNVYICSKWVCDFWWVSEDDTCSWQMCQWCDCERRPRFQAVWVEGKQTFEWIRRRIPSVAHVSSSLAVCGNVVVTFISFCAASRSHAFEKMRLFRFQETNGSSKKPMKDVKFSWDSKREKNLLSWRLKNHLSGRRRGSTGEDGTSCSDCWLRTHYSCAAIKIEMRRGSNCQRHELIISCSSGGLCPTRTSRQSRAGEMDDRGTQEPDSPCQRIGSHEEVTDITRHFHESLILLRWLAAYD